MTTPEKKPKSMESLVKARTALRGQVTKLCNRIHEGATNLNLNECRAVLTTLKSVYDRLQVITNKLYEHELVSLPDEAFADELERSTKYELALAEAEVAVKELEQTQGLPTPARQPQDTPSVTKLERLPLPIFEGDILGFAAFWNSFKVRVHQASLSPIDKFSYLTTHLKGPASEVIEALPLTEQGYEDAVNLLLRRFGRRVPLVNAHLTSLLTLPNVDDMRVVPLRRLSDSMTVNCRALVSLGVDLKRNSQVLGPMLLSRLPLTLRIKWEEAHDRGDLTSTIEGPKLPEIDVEELLSFFNRQVEHCETGIQARVDGLPSADKSVSGVGAKQSKPSLPKGAQGGRRSVLLGDSQPACMFCDGTDHYLPKECQQFMQAAPEVRHTMVKKAGICFNCLSPQHMLKKCASKFSCRQCKKRHHTLLCLQDVSDPAERSRAPAGKPNGTMLVMKSASGGIFPTIQVKAVSQNTSSKVRLLLDSCSNQSFVSPELVKKLKLPIKGQAKLSINSFDKGVVTKVYDICSLTIKSLTNNQSVVIDAFVSDLCHPLATPKVNLSRFNHLKDLQFTESYDKPMDRTIDVLIGFDHLYDIQLSEVRRGVQGGPVALSTKFGWVLHGPQNWSSLTKDQPIPVNTFHVNVVKNDPLECNFADLELIGIHNDKDQFELSEPSIVDQRFQVRLPFKNDDRPLNNVSKVYPRQNSVINRMSKQQCQDYSEYFTELEQLNIIERCPSPPPAHCWYLPNHCVWSKNKLRVVFDGSSGNPPLNQVLNTGPNLLQALPVCVTSFRLFPIPICADIEKAFLQVGVHPDDRDFVRFLVREGDRWSHFRFTRTPFGLCCSPALLNVCLRKLYDAWEDECPVTVTRLRQSMYCDDFVASFSSDMEVNELRGECERIFASVSMNLRGWSSSPSKVLGLVFDSSSDTLCVKLDLGHYKSKSPVTRREVASSVASIYDPLGFASPVTVRCKMFFQRAWADQTDWDAPLSSDLQNEWKEMCEEFHSARVCVDRHLAWSPTSVLHVFADASGRACQTVVYLVSDQRVTLLFSRNHLAPTKSKMSAPRLELVAATFSVRVVAFLKSGVKQLNDLPVYFWTDSSCVLLWIKNPSPSHPRFVQNRVNEIKVVEGVWRHCPGDDNPADLGSRGVSVCKLLKSRLWWHGPVWLSDRSEWPHLPICDPPMEVFACPVNTEPVDNSFIEQLCRVYSELRNLVWAVAGAYRFVFNCLAKKNRTAKRIGPLTFQEKQGGFYRIVSLVQLAHYERELTNLKQSRCVHSQSSLFLLKPRFDSHTNLLMGMPRTGENHKILLPYRSHLSKLVVQDTHKKLYHAGVDRVVSQLHRKYWIVKLRRLVRCQLKSCVRCQRFNGRPYGHNEGYLAPFRVDDSRPFKHTGIDFVGPVAITASKSFYFLLFTCANIRAVHLEVVPNMTVESTELAFRRFMSRRGEPEFIYSDNAASFRKMSTIINISWRFIPERAPWWGGFWERLIGTIKNSLYKTLHLSCLNRDELNTVVIEIEGIMNSRPLTYVSDVPDSVSPLRPVDFLSVPFPLCTPWVADNGGILGSRWRHRQVVVNRLLRRWKDEYLSSLRRWRGGSRSGKLPLVGDIVLVKEGSSRRNWPLARVVDVLEGRDGWSRVAVISLRGNLTRRAISLLYPLEAEPPWSGPFLRASPDPSSVRAAVSQPSSSPPSPMRSPIRTTSRGRPIRLPARYRD